MATPQAPRVKRIVNVLKLPNATSFRRNRDRPPTSLAAAHLRVVLGAADLSPVSLQWPPPAARGGWRSSGPHRAFANVDEVGARGFTSEKGGETWRSLTPPPRRGQPELRTRANRRPRVGFMSGTIDRHARCPYPENRASPKIPRTHRARQDPDKPQSRNVADATSRVGRDPRPLFSRGLNTTTMTTSIAVSTAEVGFHGRAGHPRRGVA